MILEIGTKAYPMDNSYSYTIGTDENPYLAGFYDQSVAKARKVTIVSLPYLLKAKTSVGTIQEHEFVTVSYNRKCHVVMNIFTHNKPK